MDISIFDVTGPVMVGPSSSHTAGAAKLARVAKTIVEEPFSHVSFGLHGSFAKTYQGHGTDKALVAGILGMKEDDERLANSFHLAEKAGITFEFYKTELDNVHENSVVITFHLLDGTKSEIIGSSIGGGQIIIKKIDGLDVELAAQMPTLLIRQYDKKGVVSEVTTILANSGINIGIMKLSRRAKGDEASCVIETDDRINDEVVEKLKMVPNIISVRAIRP